MKQRSISRLLQVSVILGLASMVGAGVAKPMQLNIKSYGAVGDGVAMETVEFKNVEMTLRSSDKRQMIVLDDAEGFVNH